MRFIDLDSLTSEDAVMNFKGKEHVLVEPNAYKWAEFNNKVSELDKDNVESIVELKKWLVKTIIPTLDYDEMTPSEFFATSTLCQDVFNGGICELGKKLKPLHLIVKKK